MYSKGLRGSRAFSSRSRVPRISLCTPRLTPGPHKVRIGSPSITEADGQVLLWMVMTSVTTGASARTALLLKGEPDVRVIRDMGLIAALLKAANRGLGDGSRGSLIRAMSGTEAHVTLAVAGSGFTYITAVAGQ